ncbi:MAG: uracil-DNA glycosylase [Sandaracinaceae bacterium]|nr:uracil-DNA glycosylase [Sandaracinaceae bacterium]
MGDDPRAELMTLVASVAEHLRHEMDLGNPALPHVPAPSPAPAALDASPVSVARAPEAAAAPIAAPAPAPASEQSRGERLAVLADRARVCTACRLHEGRTKSVFSRGSDRASLVFVGEGPGYHEDQQGVPFVGNAGQLLDKMIVAMGFAVDEVYICNVVKCRPPENRTPNPDEATACLPFLREQLEVVAPEVIVALGRHAAENLGVAEPGRRWRGEWGTWQGVRVMPTYHPAYLLRTPENKRVVWQDLQAVVKAMGRTLPSR